MLTTQNTNKWVNAGYNRCTAGFQPKQINNRYASSVNNKTSGPQLSNAVKSMDGTGDNASSSASGTWSGSSGYRGLGGRVGTERNVRIQCRATSSR